MDLIKLFLALFCFFLAWFYVLRSNTRRRSAKLPPGPRPSPIIGNILQLGRNPHQSLAELSKTYGPLMSLQLGSIYTVVVSSPELAKEVLQKHDQVFSGRTIAAAAQVHDHHKISMAYLPVGKEWRTIRKICKEQMFSTYRLDASQGLRREKLQKLRDYVHRCCITGRVVNIGEAAFITSLNLMSATLFSVDFTDFDSDVTQELKETIEGVAKIVGTPNLADFFPILKMIDPQGIQRQAKFYFGRLLAMFEEIINQRLQSRKATNGSPKKNDLLEALLDLSQGSEYELSCKQINHLLVDLFVAGSDTTSSTVEWAMTELLLSPEKMAKAKNELKSVIGENKQVEESDISRLPYLQAKHADIVNVWAIGRDPIIWSNPSSFEPERFMDCTIDFKGQDFMLIPFGSGRRMCPGWPLAERMLHLMVASLIHNFDWKFEPGVKPEDVDTEEKFGLSLHKSIPLKAIPVKPLSI
ncbi:UNVERIFIED_CONTAM: Ferruginol synthase [Sesamum calycinum]|uniref:Ferruginol synthase n=2 Tax=Sesamum TaxID=4181 RepID=A0AAW2QNL7_9LAMI